MLHSGYDRSLEAIMIFWTLRTCPLAGGAVILLCLFMHAEGVNMGWLGCKGGSKG